MYFIRYVIYLIKKGLGMDNDYEKVILKAGVERAISVGSAILRNNLDCGNREPMFAVWPAKADVQEPDFIFTQLDITKGTGDVRFLESYEKPLPGNSGRTVAFVVTDAELVGLIKLNRPPVKDCKPAEQPAPTKSSKDC